MLYVKPTQNQSTSIYSDRTSPKSKKCIPLSPTQQYGINPIPEIISLFLMDFENHLFKVLRLCKQKASVSKCQSSYQTLVHNLEHYFSMHYKKDELYLNSIEMKEKMLEKMKKMAEDKQQRQNNYQQAQQLLKKKILEKEAEIRKWKQISQSLQLKRQMHEQQHQQQQQVEISLKETIMNLKMENNHLQQQLKENCNETISLQYEKFLLNQAQSIEKLLSSKKKITQNDYI